MAVTVEVKSHDPTVKAQRNALACCVRDEFAKELPDLNLLAFFDDCEWAELKRRAGPDNRGSYTPIDENTFRGWYLPQGLGEQIFGTNLWVPDGKRSFDHLIYLHGSTCCHEVGLVMTFSHELQHFVQYGFKRELWVVCRLTHFLPNEVLQEVGLRNWPDVPHEREARIVAKRKAIQLCGPGPVKRYIEGRIGESRSAMDMEDWQFSLTVDASIPFDLEVETKRTIQKLKPHRKALETVLRDHRRDPGCEGIDLSTFFDGSQSQVDEVC